MRGSPGSQLPEVEGASVRTPCTHTQSSASTMTALRVASVREVFRLHRLAQQHHRLCQFYHEHNLFDAERDTRLEMLKCLRGARQQWRLVLGLA